MLAGLRASTGDYVTIMDADLQHPPLLLIKMLRVLKEEDCDCVGSYHIQKGEEIRSKMIDWFYPIFNCFSSVKLHPNAKDFQLMRRPMVEAILSLNEQTPFLKVQTEWVGFQKKWVGYEEIDRCAGKTKFSMWNLLVYALQAFVNYSYFFLVIPWVFCLLGLFSKFFMTLGVFSCFGICLLYLNQILDEVRKRPKYIIKKTNMQMARWGNGIPRDC